MLVSIEDHGVGSTDHFSVLKIWMFENKFVSLPSHLKTIEPMEVRRGSGTMCNTKTSKVISRTDPMILQQTQLIAYADNDAQRQLRIGMEAQVWPANEKRDEVGYVRGRISQVVRYPARISKVR